MSIRKFIGLSISLVFCHTLLAGQLLRLQSNDWLIFDRVKFSLNLDSAEQSQLRRENFKQSSKNQFKLADTRWKFRVNTGTVILGEGWIFNRDSVLNYHDGRLELYVEKDFKGGELKDTLILKIPDMQSMRLHFPERTDFFSAIFKSFTVDFPGYESFHLNNSYFDSARFFLRSYTLKSNSGILKNNKSGDFYIQQKDYQKDLYLAFAGKQSGKEVWHYPLSRKAYVRNISFNFSGTPGSQGQNGIAGKALSFPDEKSKQDTLDKLASEGKNAGIDGSDAGPGTSGTPGKDISVKIQRLSKTDSIALIIIETADTSIRQYLDIYNGGTLTIFSVGGKGGDGGDAGPCGHILINGRLSLYGKPGMGGRGADGAKGGNINLQVDKFYESQIYKIKLINDGGKPGFGGFKYSEYSCSGPNPYFVASLSGGKAVLKTKTYVADDLAEPGKKGPAGTINIQYFK